MTGEWSAWNVTANTLTIDGEGRTVNVEPFAFHVHAPDLAAARTTAELIGELADRRLNHEE